MTKLKLKIAFTGTYDIENYGDHLFPLIFKRKMELMKVDCDIFLFSPLGGMQGYNQGVPVYPLVTLEQMHQEENFDAIIIGGGGILHYAYGKQKVKGDTDYVDYPVFETWIIPSIVAMRNKVRIIWNIPGGYHSFIGSYAPLTKFFCQYVDYLSVRDEYTKKILVDSGIAPESINVYDDSAFIMTECVSNQKLLKLRKALIKEQKYIVYHANRFLPKEAIPILVSNLNKLKDNGYQIVLLPLAYTHDDQSILDQIQKYAKSTNYDYLTFTKALDIYDLMSILAYNDLYIGVSFHGAVTALCHHRKVIAYDYMRNGKTKDLFLRFGLGDYYLEEIEYLGEAIDKIMNDSLESSFAMLKEKQLNINSHFNRLKLVLQSPIKDRKNINLYENISDIFKQLYTDYLDKEVLSNKYKGALNELNILNDGYNDLEEVALATHVKMEELRKQNHLLSEENNRLYNKVQKIQNNIFIKVLLKLKNKIRYKK